MVKMPRDGPAGIAPHPSRLVLLDRDGTVNVERSYVTSPEQVELLPRAAEGIRALKSLGFAVVVVTNQSAVGRGRLDSSTLEAIHARLCALLAAEQAAIAAIYVCPHRPDENCPCRKPLPGLARQAAAAFGADLAQSFVIGDKPCDVGLGKNVGARTILVRTGYGTETAARGSVSPDWVAEDLADAARYVKGLRDAAGRAGNE
jgi:D-glycero-D-manno-heptose 1,7-bisphosphate phosphatase